MKYLDKSLLKLYFCQERLPLAKIAEIMCCTVGVVRSNVNLQGLKRPNLLIGKKKSEEHKLNLSKSKSGVNHYNYGKKARHTKRLWYLCPTGIYVCMRSCWELSFATYLDDLNLSWQYEPETFVLKDGSGYTPDFYVESWQSYVEVKGWFHIDHQNKFQLFKESYPDKQIILADKNYLTTNGVDLNNYKFVDKPLFKCAMCNTDFYKKDRNQRFCSKKCANIYISRTRNRNMPKQIKISGVRKYHGVQKGVLNNASVLVPDVVSQVIKLKLEGKGTSEISRVTGVSLGNIYNILNGKSWIDVTGVI